jgi:hypothetical protein
MIWFLRTADHEVVVVQVIVLSIGSVPCYCYWGVEWRVSFAADKTYGMVISRKRTPFDASGTMLKDEAIELVDSLKLAGFTFDKKMTMAPIVKEISKKGRAKLAALYRLRPYLDSSNLEVMYKAFVRSSMEYGNLEST